MDREFSSEVVHHVWKKIDSGLVPKVQMFCCTMSSTGPSRLDSGLLFDRQLEASLCQEVAVKVP